MSDTNNLTMIWSSSSYAIPPIDLFDRRDLAMAASDVGITWASGAFVGHSTISPLLVTRTGAASNQALLDQLADPAGRRLMQSADGLDGEMLHPAPGLVAVVANVTDSAQAVAIVDCYNEWISGFAASNPGHFAGIGLIPSTGLSDALSALRNAQRLGLRGVTLAHPPGGPGTSPGGEAVEFFQQAAEHGTVICLDEAFGGIAPDVSPRIAAGEAPAVAGFLPRFAFSGVSENAPSLKLMLVNVEAGWLPHTLQNADLNYMRAAASRTVELADPEALPSEYVRRMLWLSFHEDRYAVLHRDYFGEHHLLWGASLPTDGSDWPDDEEQAHRITAGLEQANRNRLLSENTLRLFNIGDAQPFTPREISRFRLAVLR
jgi:predicted TIM-barrel fold metal-dependent hydrolase